MCYVITRVIRYCRGVREWMDKKGAVIDKQGHVQNEDEGSRLVWQKRKTVDGGIASDGPASHRAARTAGECNAAFAD